MIAGSDSRTNYNERQQSDINFKSDSEYKIAYKLCKSSIYTLCTIELKIIHHSPRLI